MKRVIFILLSFLSTSLPMLAESLSVTLSINSLTTETPVVLVKTGEVLEMDCGFTANVSLYELAALENTLNTQLDNAGISSLDIVNVRKHPTSYSLFMTLRFSSLGFESARTFNISTTSGMVTITLIRDSDGKLDDFALNGQWLSETSEDFTLELSGSQQAVTYLLQKDGITKRTMMGTGWALDFGQFNGMSSHGTYQVVARYKDWEERIVGTVTMVRKEDIGGNNYTAVRTFVSDDGEEHYTDITYYNGLGYPEQEINIDATSDSMNLVRPIVYDDMLRSEATSYIPYCSTGASGMYIQDAIQEHRIYYIEHSFPYHENTFESGPSGRPMTSQKPGKAYRDNAKKVTMEYGVNDGTEDIIEFIYNRGSSAAVRYNRFYQAGDLHYTKTTSENEDISYVFSDKFNKTILHRKVSNGIDHDTYFIYDLKDSLVCVIQPEGSASVPDMFEFNDSFCNNYCFTYTYDGRGNIIEKTVPGAGREVMVYDQRNRLVLYADSELLSIGKYKYIIYDLMDRVTHEGYSSLTTSLGDIRTLMQTKTTILPYISSSLITRHILYYASDSSQSLSINGKCRAYRQGISYEHCLTLPATEVIYEEPHIQGGTLSRGSYSKTRHFYYDDHSRLTLLKESYNDGWTSVYSWQNDFTGNVLKHTEEHYNNQHFDSMVITYTYDKRGRRRTMVRNLNGVEFAPVSYDYDAFGRMRVKKVEGRGYEVYGYNLQGWQDCSSAYFYGYDLFSQTMTYQHPFLRESEARYDGLVSEVMYRHLGQDTHTVAYGYDGVGRLASSSRYLNRDSTACHTWSEDAMEYDLNGNLIFMARINNNHVEDIWKEYQGNRMIWSSILGNGDNHYDYYADGNLKTDPCRNLQIQYNMLNLPAVVTEADGQSPKARYYYFADGSRYRVYDASGNGYVYRGTFVYNLSPTGMERLESVGHDEGRFIALSSSAATTQFIDTWHVKDYLGNVRVVLDITNDTSVVVHPSFAVLEQDDYLPFGTRADLDSLAYDPSNRYRFNGKEEQVIGNIGLIDYGARFYDPDLSRWTTPDPLAEKYYSISPYAFCNNNPVNFVDPDGRFPVALPLLPIVFKTAAVAGGLTLTFWAADKFAQSYESSKYNPGYENQKEQDRRNKRALDQAQLNVQNSINNNFPDPNQHDPNDGPNMKRGSNLKKAAFLSLALIGENYEFLEELIKNFLLNDEGEEKKEIDTDANVEVFVSPTPKEEQDKLDEQTEGINYIYHFLWDQGPYPEYFGTY